MLKYYLKIKNIKFLGLPIYLWALFILFSILKIWLVSAQNIYAIGPAAHDDRLFLMLADNIIHFKWLGNFNNLTLAKGPFYPIWIALVYALHIPLLLSQQILYAISCLAIIFSLKSIIKNAWWLGAFYIILIFNPMTFTDGPATRVIREGIYPALTLFVIAFFISILLNYKSNIRKIFILSLGAGISLSCLWFTREEGVWIIPFTGLLISYSIFMIWKERDEYWKKKIIIFLFPFLLLYISIQIVSIINYYNYGSFETVEFKDHAFLSAYGALTRVKGPIWVVNVPVSTAQRKLIYPVSPAFAELRTFLEGDSGSGWTNISIANSEKDGINEIKGGWFLWAFRDAVAQAGYYKNGKIANDYYQKLANEINLACQENKIDCSAQHASMLPPLNSNYINPFMVSFIDGTKFAFTFKGFDVISTASIGDKASLKLFTKMTNEKIKKTMSKNDSKAISVLNSIGKMYQFFIPILAIMSSAVFVLLLIKNRFKINLLILISIALLITIFMRIAILAMFEITSAGAINTLYMSSLYPLIIIWCFLMIYESYTILKKR